MVNASGYRMGKRGMTHEVEEETIREPLVSWIANGKVKTKSGT